MRVEGLSTYRDGVGGGRLGVGGTGDWWRGQGGTERTAGARNTRTTIPHNMAEVLTSTEPPDDNPANPSAERAGRQHHRQLQSRRKLEIAKTVASRSEE